MIQGILVGCSQNTAKTGSPYCTLKIKNLEGEVVVNVWGSTSDKFKLWSQITITGEKVSDQGSSCNLSQIEFKEVSDKFRHLLPYVPTYSDWELLVKSVGSLMNAKENQFFVEKALLLYKPYSQAAAAKVNHHAYPGGLLAHTYQLLNIYKAVRSALPFKTNPFIVAVSCLFHDYLKLSEYDLKTLDYQPIMFLKGHVVGSAEVLGELMRKSDFDSNLILHCQHCILAHHGRQEWGSPVLPATVEAFLVHHLDMLSGHGVMFEETPNNTRSFALGTTVFHYE